MPGSSWCALRSLVTFFAALRGDGGPRRGRSAARQAVTSAMTSFVTSSDVGLDYPSLECPPLLQRRRMLSNRP